jgi:hypothetical protein
MNSFLSISSLKPGVSPFLNALYIFDKLPTDANRLSHVDLLGAHEDRGVYRSVLALTRGGLWVRYRVGGREDGRLHAGGSRGRRQGLGGGGAVFGIYGCGWSSSSEMSDLWVVVVVVVFESPPRCWV